MYAIAEMLITYIIEEIWQDPYNKDNKRR